MPRTMPTPRAYWRLLQRRVRLVSAIPAFLWLCVWFAIAFAPVQPDAWARSLPSSLADLCSWLSILGHSALRGDWSELLVILLSGLWVPYVCYSVWRSAWIDWIGICTTWAIKNRIQGPHFIPNLDFMASLFSGFTARFWRDTRYSILTTAGILLLSSLLATWALGGEATPDWLDDLVDVAGWDDGEIFSWVIAWSVSAFLLSGLFSSFSRLWIRRIRGRDPIFEEYID